jgi:single-stranded-DNA-specific exonuclease
VQEEKKHGIVTSKIPVYSDIVVIPDAGSNQFTEQRLVAQNKQVLIIDHHSMDRYEVIDNVIICNNQISPNFENKSLSGAGMVYKVIQRYSSKYHDGQFHRRYIDLAAIGIISDMMDTRDIDNNYIIYYGLKNLKNPLMKAILLKQSYSVSSPTVPNKIDIAFYVTPLINAVIRAGTFQENTNFFKTLIDYNNIETFVNDYRGKVTQETIYERIAREAYNTRNRQNKIKEKSLEFLDQSVKDNNLENNTILTIISSREDDVTLPKTMTGLVAMEFVKKYKKPVLVMRPRNDNGTKVYAGSGRANSVDGFDSFRNALNDSNLVEYAEGHDNAFGVSVKAENLEKLNQYMNSKFKDIDFGNETIEVDYIFNFEDINLEMLWQFATHSDLYGNSIPQPKFAFKFFLNKDLVKVMGKSMNTVKFTYSNVNFLKFNAEDIISELGVLSDDLFSSSSKNLEITIVGRSQINEFNGVKSLQVVIDNFASKEVDRRNLI